MNSEILINTEVLSQSGIPEKLLHREKELSHLISNIKNSINTLITGSNGSGKTTLVKQAIDKSKIGVYVDCSLYQTTYSVLKEIIPNSRLVLYRSNYELLKELYKKSRDNKFTVCLDHFEHLKDIDIIGKFMSLGLTVVLVSENEDCLLELEGSVRSNISSTIKLSQYTVDQTFDILKNRAELALAKWTYTDAVIRKIAELCEGNISLGLNVLKVAALKAEGENKKAIEEVDIPIIEDCPLKLNADEKILLKILEEWKSLPSSRISDFYMQKARHPKGERSFRNYMESLCSKGLIKAIGDKRGRIYEIVQGEENVSSEG